jgi:hypothetical protein
MMRWSWSGVGFLVESKAQEKKMVLFDLQVTELTKVRPFLAVPATDACKSLSFDSEIRTDGHFLNFVLRTSSTWQPTHFWYHGLSFLVMRNWISD